MIRRLRWKVVGLNMGMVFCVLLAVFAAVFFFARSALSRSVRQQMEEAVRTGVYDLSQPDGSTLPCFVAEVYASGTVRVSGNGYYDLTDKSALAAIVTAALSAQEDEGVLADYHLRYLRSVGLLSTRIAFTDSTLEQATLRGLLTGSLLIGFVALAVLFACSYVLSGAVTRPVARAWQQQKQFVADASHELKTPVTILKGQLSGMLEGVGVYQDREKYLLRSLRVTGRMENLVQEMLAISRMESGSVAVKREPVELSALIERQLALDAPLLEQRNQRLVKDLTPGIVVIGDASLLGRVAGNLLSNASLYSPEGAEVRVWCGLLDGRPALTVENTEAHISEKALPHLFEAFYREETSRNRATGGSGLGLYLVKMILARHGAECTIENTEDGVLAVVLFEAGSISGLPAGDMVE